jgi:hypothetical protein
MAAVDLTTIANLKGYLGQTAASEDAQLARLVTAVSVYFAGFCDRTFQSGPRVYIRNGPGGVALPLPEFPVSAVATVLVDGVSLPARPSVGVRGWVLAEDVVYLDGGAKFTKGVQNIEIDYTAGYTTTPLDLEQACIECCASWYKRSKRVDEQSRTAAGGVGEVVSFSLADVPNSAMMILNLYSRPWPR